MNLHLKLNSFVLLKGVSAFEVSAFETDSTSHLVIKSNTILLPDKDKIKKFQLRDTADFHLNTAVETYCQLFPKAKLPITKLVQQNCAHEFLRENVFGFLPSDKT